MKSISIYARLRATPSLLGIALLSGCASGPVLNPGPAGASSLGEVAGVKPDTSAADYPIDLVRLIYTPDKSLGNVDVKTIEQARAAFDAMCIAQSSERCATLRNQIQDRLMWASESACGDYLRGVRKSFTSTNLNLGSATTFFGALGSVVASQGVSRVFSGTAGLLSGVRAEYNDVYFSSQAFELVSKAIRAVREKSHKTIMDGRAGKTIVNYTLEAAIGDAMRYHGTCNVMAGLEEAADAVTRDRDPGLKRLSELLQGVSAGVNLSLGTAVLDTSAVPLIGQSCLHVASVAAEGAKVAEQTAAADKKIQEDATATTEAKAESKKNREASDGLAAELKKINDDMAADCTANTGAVAKAEKDMLEQMRIFPLAPLAEKAIAKASFDAARGQVLVLKARLDKVLDAAQGKLAAIKAKAPKAG